MLICHGRGQRKVRICCATTAALHATRYPVCCFGRPAEAASSCSYNGIDRQILPTPRRCLTFDEAAPKAQLVGVCCKAGRAFCNTFGTNDIYCAQEGTWGNKTYANIGTYCKTGRFPVSSDVTARLCCEFGKYPLPDGKLWSTTG